MTSREITRLKLENERLLTENKQLKENYDFLKRSIVGAIGSLREMHKLQKNDVILKWHHNKTMIHHRHINIQPNCYFYNNRCTRLDIRAHHCRNSVITFIGIRQHVIPLNARDIICLFRKQTTIFETHQTSAGNAQHGWVIDVERLATTFAQVQMIRFCSMLSTKL